MIYFDNSATTPINKTVLDTYVKTSERIMGNPSSLHFLGTQASRLIQQARFQIAELLGVEEPEIYFTSGGTEGDNWVIKGTAIEKHSFGKHLIVSSIEHSAVSSSAKQLEKLGFEIDIAPVDTRGFIDVARLKELIRPDTILVSTMLVNNEIGAIQPIDKISEVLADYPTIHYHVDAVQGLGKVPVKSWLTERVDFATFSSHKFHGPKGTGFIYWKLGRKLAPLLNGGGQEKGKRSGTENVPGIVAMSRAVRLHLEDEALKINHQTRLRDYLIESLQQFDKVTLFSEANDEFAPHIVCFGIKGIKGEVLVHAFEEKDIIISTTSACSSRAHTAGSTLGAMNVPNDKAITAVRVSFSDQSTMMEVEKFLTTLKHLNEKFSKIN
ncbi:cysteine desulfurase family protein [Vagococcus xieshaowenii]|uniref:Cysteine desulfurase n=1 Tax=Vagococcus xieshaowenii TaxID=2562451 RepID=A0AAJ5JQP6_9ENTE|nr:cysteine desulfurase family protein [Vagococcus xieshaowenii]QCA28046.1 cysteine desulfurase [Vagococcus xieshaowenii]TFZ42098.1 cysteine desulfurase [Vagococcus xieshaowenii]